jgi:antitoxin (DNA-binding transcriptional repressor) of toxin-antitoxin stability system
VANENQRIMQIVSAREFRASQGKFLNAAKEGQTVLLTSRVGSFRIVPVNHDDETLTESICESLREVKMIRDGVIKGKKAEDLLNEL